MATTTLGVKVDESIRERLRNAASQLDRSAHALHKQALVAYLQAIEQGYLPEEIQFVPDGQGDTNQENVVASSRVTPFFDFAQDVQPQSVLRASISSAYRRPESECLPMLLEQLRVLEDHEEETEALARRLIEALRARGKGSGVDGLVHEFSLSSQEGVALMCLAEALLRIPDSATRDALIRDKISHGDWRAHITDSSSLFVNAATWGLVLTGKLVTVNSEQSLSRALTRLIAKGGEPLVRRGVNTAMRLMGEQFVTGQTISAAIANARKREQQGFRYSYDMLGEAATTAEDAQGYYDSYEQAIHAIGNAARGKGIYEGPGISIKLSALHPRYSRAQRERVMTELLPRLFRLVSLARSYDIGVNIDAEEADRLEISLDILERLCTHADFAGWHGIGFVVQAYQKRAPYVVDFIIDLAQRTERRIMVRLVKGAYWDTEIKRAQVDGLEGYPVYTRKVYTDVSFLACARKLLSAPQAVYPQFATHNAQTLAAVYHMAGQNYYPGQYEFQCLHGMGEALYEAVTGPTSEGKLNRPCRIYAPVGTHDTLLAYLVRRLLENGANTSFVNQVTDGSIAVEQLVANPVTQAAQIVPYGSSHPKIPLPRHIYGPDRHNSEGFDLTSEQRLASLSAALMHSATQPWRAWPMVGSEAQDSWDENRAQAVRSPSDHRDIVGHVIEANETDVREALQTADRLAPIWQSTDVSDRAECLRQAARIMEEEMQPLLGLIVREAGKSLPNAVAEIREAVDFLRYYALQIESEFNNDTHRPLGTVLCISPWNFPLAIFIGQVSAALAAGNVVLAKPAEQTSLIAAQAIDILYRAGVPRGAVQLLPGTGEAVGARLVEDAAVGGVMFTGSTQVAHAISNTLAKRLDQHGHTIPLVAETGGLNAMVVDSSALAEQVIIDILDSAFDSAGQRCSALRLLCIQEDTADTLIPMLRSAMRELSVGNPTRLSVDVGPVIDQEAQAGINTYIEEMRQAGYQVDQLSLHGVEGKGTYIEPTLIEVDSADAVTREVFGPVLHVMRYRRDKLDELIDTINGAGYGLTFGVHTRIDETVAQVASRIRVGNVYVNRNIVGAVVGVQPFGGEGLSGTGPKAGGPLYVKRLLSRAPQGLPAWYTSNQEQELDGPTGERNTYRVGPRGTVLCIPVSAAGAHLQLDTCLQTGNVPVFLDTPITQDFIEAIPDKDRPRVETTDYVPHGDYQAVLFEGHGDALKSLAQQVAARHGPIIGVQGLSPDEIEQGARYRAARLLREVSMSVNTAAAGGNASLMMVG